MKSHIELHAKLHASILINVVSLIGAAEHYFLDVHLLVTPIAALLRAIPFGSQATAFLFHEANGLEADILVVIAGTICRASATCLPQRRSRLVRHR